MFLAVGIAVVYVLTRQFARRMEQINTMVMSQCSDKGLTYECRMLSRIDDYYIGDNMKLKEVLTNILSNAIKFTEAPGSVTMTVERTAVFEDQSTLCFRIKDTGIGMDKEFIPKIFEAFSQEDGTRKTKYGSTGLGMAITKSIVEMMNGSIAVESEKGVGTEFAVTVTLRNCDKKAEEREDAIDPSTMHVLVVDDDLVAAEHARMVLDEVGIRADICNSGQEALRMIEVQRTKQNPYNLVLMDWSMPEMNGMEATKAIREQHDSETTVVVLTAYNWDDIQEEAHSVGLDSFLSKPLFASNVIEEFERVARRNNMGLFKAKQRAEMAGRRILLAEDMEINAEIIMDLLSMEDVESEHAENGRIAVEMFSSHESGYYDAILMDVRMPKMDGLEATAAIRAMAREDAKRIPIIRRITLPIVKPAIMSTFLLVFASSMSAYSVPVFLGSPVRYYMLSTKMKSLMDSYPGQAYIIASVMIAMGVIILLLNHRVTGSRRNYTTVTGKSGQISKIKLGRANHPIAILLVIVMLLVAVAPLLTFAMESVIIKAGDYTPGNMTLDFWIGTNLAERLDQGDSTGILLNPRVWNALGYSLALAVVSAFIAGTCGMLLGYGMAKRRGSRLANMVNSLAFFPYLIPSLAFGAIYLAMGARLPWLWGFALLALVGSVKYLPFSSRAGLNAMLQLSGEIEEAAIISGVAVDHLDLQILSNAFITLLGPSGCGKTTILRMIAGLETPTEGRITIGGKVVFDSDEGINLPPNKREVGFLFQNYTLWPHMTVYQNIAFGLENMKWEKDRIAERVRELLAMLRIEAYEKSYPSELSGGQQQRVAIARTLAPGPRVLFMDEPLSNLDAKLRMEMRTELKRLHRDTDSTFVYVTHDQQEAMTLSTMVCVIDKGRLQQYAPPLQMYNNPASVFVAHFLGNPSMNFLDGRLSEDGALDFAGIRARFEPFSAVALPAGDVIVGIRPEYVRIGDDGNVEGTVYTTLPSGMETTVKMDVNGTSLTSVVFGDVDFPVDRKVKFSFNKATILFDRQSGRALARGALVLP